MASSQLKSSLYSLVFTILLFFAKGVKGQSCPDCSGKKRDVVFVLDSSGSLGADRFASIVVFVDELINNNSTTPGACPVFEDSPQTRVGVVFFGRSGVTETHEITDNRTSVVDVVNNKIWDGGFSHIKLSLTEAKNMFLNASSSNTTERIVVLINEGPPTAPGGFEAQDPCVDPLFLTQYLGVVQKTLVIGFDVDPSFNLTSLSCLVQDEATEMVEQANDFAGFNHSFFDQLCDVGSPAPSTSPSAQPSNEPSTSPSASNNPSTNPSHLPSFMPSMNLSQEPSHLPSTSPSTEPSARPSGQPSAMPSTSPTTVADKIEGNHQELVGRIEEVSDDLAMYMTNVDADLANVKAILNELVNLVQNNADTGCDTKSRSKSVSKSKSHGKSSSKGVRKRRSDDRHS